MKNKFTLSFILALGFLSFLDAHGWGRSPPRSNPTPIATRSASPSGPQLSSISITPNGVQMVLGSPFSRVKFRAIALMTDGKTMDVTELASWSSSNLAAVKVSDQLGSKGIAYFLSVGVAQLRVSYSLAGGTPANATTQASVVNDPCFGTGTPSFALDLVGRTLKIRSLQSNTQLQKIVNGRLFTSRPADDVEDFFASEPAGTHFKVCYKNSNGFSNTIEYVSAMVPESQKLLVEMPSAALKVVGSFDSRTTSVATVKKAKCLASGGDLQEFNVPGLAFRCPATQEGKPLQVSVGLTQGGSFTPLPGHEARVCMSGWQRQNYCFCLGARVLLEHEDRIYGTEQTPARQATFGVRFANLTETFRGLYRTQLQTAAPGFLSARTLPMGLFGFLPDTEVPAYLSGQLRLVNIDVFNRALSSANPHFLTMLGYFEKTLPNQPQLTVSAQQVNDQMATDPIAQNRVTRFEQLWPTDWLNSQCSGVSVPNDPYFIAN